MDFPDEFPPGCPEGSRPYTGYYFRFCSSRPKKPEHPKNHEAPIGRFKGPRDEAPCGEWGLSGYLSVDDLEEARQHLITYFPNAATWPQMVYALTPQDGEIKHTPMPVSEKHHDLWVYKGVDIAQRLV